MDTRKISNISPSKNNDPYIGTMVKDRYLIEKELGRGGIGVVYLAKDKQLLDKPVVIKVLLEDSLQDNWLRNKFQQEVEALARIDHPSIVTVFDVGQLPNGNPYFVMQFVEGVTLRSRINRSGMEFLRASNIIRQIGQALTAVHEKGIYHRDLKPENIMLQSLSEGEELAKIIDFGIAKVENSQLDANTATSLIIGTIIYMAPEQLMAKPVSALSDIYSFGVIAYEMLTGQLPFNPISIFELLDRQRKGVEVLPTELRENLPPSAEAILLRALSFDPTKRYQRARDFGEELSQALAIVSIPSISESAATLKLNSRKELLGDLASEVNENKIPSPMPRSAAVLAQNLEPVGGAVPLDSEFYIVRPVDKAFYDAIARQDSIVLIKGARQMGKTSLLARGLQEARKANAQIVLTDFQRLNATHLASVDALFLALAELIADQLDLDVYPRDVWHAERGASINFERYMRREVLKKLSAPLVWGLDEVDRLFSCDFASEVFGLFRSWHNARSLDPTAPWKRLTLTIAYATEAHLFITDINQSPFNVGTRLALEDFNLEQVTELNKRYGSPLKSSSEIARFFELLNGQPYLVRCGLHEMVSRGIDITTLEFQADKDEGPFYDHLRRILISLNQDPQLCETMKGILHQRSQPKAENFYRLRSVGLISGNSAEEVKLRCKLYEKYLRQNL